MPFRLFLLLLLPALLAACGKTNAPIRLDFIGNPVLTSGNKTVNANDTLRTRVYAQGNDALLKRLTISDTYVPGLLPIAYPLPLASFDPTTAPAEVKITYLDSLIRPRGGAGNGGGDFRGGEYVFENQFSARATSGTELWQYVATDQGGQSAARAYLLTVRKPDSAVVYHSYTTILRPRPDAPTPADSARDRARVFLNLGYGLLLPRYAVLNNEATVLSNQQLVDVICRVRGGSVVFDAPAYPTQLAPPVNPRWPQRRATRLRRTALTAEDFGKAITAASFATAFANGTKFTDSLSTGVLAKPQVVAFRTTEGKTGLLLVTDLTTGTAPRLNCSVRVQK